MERCLNRLWCSPVFFRNCIKFEAGSPVTCLSFPQICKFQKIISQYLSVRFFCNFTSSEIIFSSSQRITIVFELVCHCKIQKLDKNVTLYVIILTTLLLLSKVAQRSIRAITIDYLLRCSDKHCFHGNKENVDNLFIWNRKKINIWYKCSLAE